jgi:hypothetical protein
MQPSEEAGQGEGNRLEMLKLLVVIAAAAALSGCATIARGTGEQVAFDTVPSGAEVRAGVQLPRTAEGVMPSPDMSMGCITPCVLQVKRNDKLAVRITREGYEPEAFYLDPTPSAEGVAGSVAGNMLLAGGVGGVLIDGVSGAAYDKCPNPVRITLRPIVRGRGPISPGYDPVPACVAFKASAEEAASRSPPI